MHVLGLARRQLCTVSSRWAIPRSPRPPGSGKVSAVKRQRWATSDRSAGKPRPTTPGDNRRPRTVTTHPQTPCCNGQRRYYHLGTTGPESPSAHAQVNFDPHKPASMEEPARKKQKLQEASPDGNAPPHTRHMNETDAGIEEYVSSHQGFFAILKRRYCLHVCVCVCVHCYCCRYSDFMVQECAPDGSVVHLTNLSVSPDMVCVEWIKCKFTFAVRACECGVFHALPVSHCSLVKGLLWQVQLSWATSFQQLTYPDSRGWWTPETREPVWTLR